MNQDMRPWARRQIGTVARRPSAISAINALPCHGGPLVARKFHPAVTSGARSMEVDAAGRSSIADAGLAVRLGSLAGTVSISLGHEQQRGSREHDGGGEAVDPQGN